MRLIEFLITGPLSVLTAAMGHNMLAVASFGRLRPGALGSNSGRQSAAAHLYYVDSVEGNDANDGLSPATAWATGAKVNGFSYPAGAITVCFKGSQTFGAFDLPRRGGTRTAPFTITSYGTGRAVFSAGFYNEDIAGFIFDNIEAAGIKFGSETATGTYDFIQIKNCRITADSYIGSDAGTSGFSNVLVDNNTFVNAGFSAYSSYTPRPHSNVTVTNNTITAAAAGIQLGGITNFRVEGNTVSGAHDIAGIWCYSADNGVIRNNVSHDNFPRSGQTADGDGIDIDEDTSNILVERNLTYNNQGAGLIISAFHVANDPTNIYGGSIFNPVMRDNISINDCAGSVMAVSLQLVTNGSPSQISNVLVYNNTIYQSRAGKACIGPTTTGITGRVADNIFYTAGTALTVNTFNSINPSGLVFNGNDYFGASTSIKWNGTTYAGPAAWRAAFPTQETLNGNASYLLADPKLVNPGTNIASDYKLQAGSPMLGGGVDLFSAFGISPAAIDYFGSAAIAGLVGASMN